MTVISDSSEAAAFCQRLRQCQTVTVDTEFMRERTYWPILCLVQLAGDDEAAAIDPRAPDMDLEPLFELLRDESVLKVFHAGRQDLEIFYHLTGQVPHPIFDTQVAGMVCGFGDQVSYEQLAKRLAGARIDKASRFTDWCRRPLTEKQIEYAIADVTHLRTIYKKLGQQLQKNKRTAWLSEEMDVLTSPETYAVDHREVWRRIKIRGAKPRQLAVLRELAAWREETAQTRDVPRNRVMKDDVLVQIATQQPANREDLGRVRMLPGGFANSADGKAVLAAVAKGIAVPKEDAPTKESNGRPDQEPPGALVDLLKTLLKAKCEAAGVATKLVANMAEVERIAAEDDPESPLMHGWRYEIFGADAQKLKKGELALSAGPSGLKIIDLTQTN
jgi:ribonuclease D